MKTFSEGYIGYAGQLDDSSGYGRSGYAAIRNLIDWGLHVTHYGPNNFNVPGHYYLEPRMGDLDDRTRAVIERQDRAEPEWALVHSIANAALVIPTPKKVIWTMWETHEIPQRRPVRGYADWDTIINQQSSGLIVPTTGQRDLFREGGVQVPIEIVHMGINTDKFPKRTKARSGKPFTFFSWSLMDSRKAPREALNCFLSAFGPNNPDVRLVMKTMHNQFGLGDFGIPTIPFSNVQIINEQWPQPKLLDFLHNEVDACVFLSRGEGFYMPPLEALSTGLPVIVSHNSGSSEFCDERYVYPVNQRGWEPCQYGEGALWVQPDFDHAIHQMRRVYEDYTYALTKAEHGAGWVRDRWSIQHQSGDLRKALVSLTGESPC